MKKWGFPRGEPPRLALHILSCTDVLGRSHVLTPRDEDTETSHLKPSQTLLYASFPWTGRDSYPLL